MSSQPPTYTTEELLELANASAAAAEVTARTLRYYASLKLIDPPITRQGQPARYSPRHLDQLAHVRQRRDAGRGLAEIAAEIANGHTSQSPVQRPAITLPEPLPMPRESPTPDRTAPDPTGELARVVFIAPGVHLVLTGSALADPDLLDRLIAAARTDHHRAPTPRTPLSNGAN